MKATVENFEEYNRALKDLLYIYYHPKMFINEKNYTTKLIEILFKLGYYEDMESLFKRKVARKIVSGVSKGKAKF